MALAELSAGGGQQWDLWHRCAVHAADHAVEERTAGFFIRGPDPKMVILCWGSQERTRYGELEGWNATLDPIRCTLCVKSSLEPGGTQRTKSDLSPERVYR